MLTKRCFDLVLTFVGVILLSPFFLIISLWIKFDSPGPVFFRQERVGRFGNPFRIYKFRTMVSDAEKLGKQITIGDDKRITRSGSFLRKYKLDELPQLFNIIKGEMSLVGPRPEVPRYVKEYPLDIREIVLSVPPGITDLAAIEFKDENKILGCSRDPEQEYIKKVLPVKLKYYLKYVNDHNLVLDLKLILMTIKAILW